MRISVVLALAACLIVSGCTAANPFGSAPTLPDCVLPSALFVPADGKLAIQGDHRIDLLFLAPKDKARFTEVRLPDKWKWDFQDIAGENQSGSFLRIGVKPAAVAVPGAGRTPPDPTKMGAPVQPAINWTAQGAADKTCKDGKHGSQALHPDLSSSGAGSSRGVGAAGKGAYVRYAGFYTNGTLFGTNMKAVDGIQAWPRSGAYSSGADQPLAVYIYDKDRKEGDDSPLWNPKDPQGQSVGWRYSSTIKGFNTALKGLPAMLPKVVVVPAQDAYGGRPGHLLNDEVLVFYIVLEETVDVPCPPQHPNRSLCRNTLNVREDAGPVEA